MPQACPVKLLPLFLDILKEQRLEVPKTDQDASDYSDDFDESSHSEAEEGSISIYHTVQTVPSVI